MKVRRLSLRHFRNIREASFTPAQGLNFLLGSNGQGKTSFLEALGFLSTLRSFRGSKAAEVISYGETFSEASCELSTGSQDWDQSDDWTTQLKISFSRSDGESDRASKSAFINGKGIKSSNQYLSQRFGSVELGFHSVVFNPSDHDLVKGDPSIRRSFIDRALAAEDVEYLKNLQKYQKLLEQRNAVLKNSERPQPELLMGFTIPLAIHAAGITSKRLEWIQRLAEKLDRAAHKITQKDPFLRLTYLSGWVPPTDNLCLVNNNLGSVHFAGQGALPSLELLEQAFWKKLSTLEAAEWRVGHSLVGPHRDDWTFFQGNQVLKGHGSQGEIRSALLALKLSEIELFQERTGHRPIFLLDDFSSELDQERRSFLLRYLSEMDLQVFVTTTDLSEGAGRRFWVSNGNLKDSGHDRNDSARR